MKRLLFCILLLTSVVASAQTHIGDRIVARNALYLKDYWLTGVQRDTSYLFFGDANKFPTALAVQQYVAGRLASLTGASGTVTNVTTGNLSPLFTASVSNPSTTPALSFSLSNAGAYSLFGRGASTGAPSYLSSIDSNWIPALHSLGYYNTKYASINHTHATPTLQEVILAGVDLTANNTVTSTTGKTFILKSSDANQEGSLTVRKDQTGLKYDYSASVTSEIRLNAGGISQNYTNESLGQNAGIFIGSTGMSLSTSFDDNTGVNQLIIPPNNVSGFYYTGNNGFYSFPRTTPSLGQTLQSDNQGYLQWVTPSGAGISQSALDDTAAAIRSAIGTGGSGASGLNSLNGLTGSSQTFATGTSGSNFSISSSGSTHTFNIPSASASNRGLLSAADWSTFNSKGSGTVTNFSSGTLSPLFTTGVSTSTSTPALTYSLSNASAYSLFGRAASTGAPSYLSSIDSNWIPALHSLGYYNTRYSPRLIAGDHVTVRDTTIGGIPYKIIDANPSSWHLGKDIAVAGDTIYSTARPYKVYVALMTQSGGAAPTATVLENTLGGSIVWTRFTDGGYEGTLIGAFTANKTVAYATASTNGLLSGYGLISISRSNDDTVTISTVDTSIQASSDQLLDNSTIEIRVYQ